MAKGLLLSRANLELAALASSDSTRTNLAGLYVTPECTVATDGHALGIVDAPQTDGADFPRVAGMEPQPAETLKPCIIPTDGAKRMVKALPRRSRVPVLEHACVDVAHSNVNGTFRAVTTDLETTTPIEVRKVDGEFPMYSQVIPGGEPVFSIGFDTCLLRRVLDVAVKCKGRDYKGAAGFRFDFYGPDAPVKITGTNDGGQRLTFLVMPYRL